MSDGPKKKSQDIMTPERLRAHWFGKQRVPFWNYDPAQLTMGLEIEYFIAKVQGDHFELATKEQYFSVIENLIQDFGYRNRDLKDQPGRVSKDTDAGFIAIKPDFAWHILEIALPPRHTVEELRSLLESTFAEVDAALAKVGLQRLDLSCLPDIPERMELVELDRLSGYLINPKETLKECDALRVFPALIVATHVHINCSDEDSLKYMPALYEVDREAQSMFMRDQLFQGKLRRDARTKLYELSFGDGYSLRTNPPVVPADLDDYVNHFNNSPRIFPNDQFFPVRDMSYIRPTRHGTFEFRGACSFLEIDKIIEIAAFRRDQVLSSCVPSAYKKIARSS